MTTATISRLTETEKARIRYWIHTIGSDLAAADTRNKDPSLEKWSNNLSDNIDYDRRLEQGLYDRGVAIICGQLRRGPYSGKYLSVLDFDNLEALESFLKLLGITLQQLGRWTRVEWHENQAKIHVFLITSSPFKNIAPAKGLEVMGEKKLTFVSPSINKDGNPYKPYDTEQIVILDDVNKMKIENIIDTFVFEKTGCSYLSEDGKKQYLAPPKRTTAII
jgi:Bifunctional DNA primase/polymerase, N-terminal